MEHGIEGTLFILVIGVVIMGAISVVSNRIGVAVPLVLVVVGAGIGAIPGAPALELEPELFLAVLLPPLIYAAARNVPFIDFQRSAQVIAILAVGLVAVSAVAVGVLVHLAWPAVSLALAIALGAVVAPPDAVAASAIGKRLGLPKRVVTILEGEALCNDATALVLLSIASSIAVSGATVEPGSVVLGFLWSVVSAVLIGALVGALAVFVRRISRDEVLDLAIGLATPFAAFLATEAVHGSGVVAVVAAGIYVGNVGPFRLRPASRAAEGANWASFAVILENGVFLYMGYRLPAVLREAGAEQGGELWRVIVLGLAAALVLILVRLLVMPLVVAWIRVRAKNLAKRQRRGEERLDRVKAAVDVDDERVSNRIRLAALRLARGEHDLTAERDEAIGSRDALVLGWAGMRGVITVMAVETLPRIGETRSSLVLIAYVVAVATLLLHGLTLAPLVRRLGLARDETGSLEDETAELLDVVSEAGLAALEREPLEPGEAETARATVASFAERWRRRTRRRSDARRRAGDADVAATYRLSGVLNAAELLELRRQHALGAFSSEAVGAVLGVIDRQELARAEFAPIEGEETASAGEPSRGARDGGRERGEAPAAG